MVGPSRAYHSTIMDATSTPLGAPPLKRVEDFEFKWTWFLEKSNYKVNSPFKLRRTSLSTGTSFHTYMVILGINSAVVITSELVL